MGRGQELLDAAREGDRRTVEKIIGQISKRSGPFTSLLRGAGVNVQDDNGYTPLHHACLHGHKEIVRLLLSVDASPCIVDKKGATPLHLAAFKGDFESVQRILAHNSPPANIDAQTSDHETALLIAAQFGFVSIVAALIEKGADVTIKNISEDSPLDLASQYGRLKTVEYLLKVRPQLVDPYKPPISKVKVFPTTPLNRASKNGRKEVVSVLIAAGIDPNIRTYEGTPLHEAARYNRASVVRVLLKNGADLNMKDRRGNTVYDLLAEYPEEATRRLMKVIREYESKARPTYDSDEDLPPFPVHDCSPTPTKGPETQKKTNTNESLLSPSSSSITKNHHQSFVKKLASKCLGLKAKFSSAPNISNNAGLESEVDVKSKRLENKSSMNTLLIGNSKFFKILSKKEESGEVVCNYEFDTISLDRAGTLNRDSVVNRSNRSCPGFKTSLPNISENNELSDSQESLGKSAIMNDNISKNKIDFAEALNLNIKVDIFEPRDRLSIISGESANFVNECYESFEFSKSVSEKINKISSLPRPAPRPNVIANPIRDNSIYENIAVVPKTIPTPAARTHVPPKVSVNDMEKKALYENINLIHERKPEPPKRSIISPPIYSNNKVSDYSPNASRSSTLSSDSMVDESNLEDIFLSQKSKSFRHGKVPSHYSESGKLEVYRTRSNSSGSSDVTEASAIENVDCSEELLDNNIYLSMTGTLPNKKTEKVTKKKVLFRHKTFTNIEVDRNSTKVRDLPQWNNEFLKETLAHYHIRGTGHCIYKAPTVKEFLNFFNRDTLGANLGSSLKGSHKKRDSYYETAICFCKPRPLKNYSSAENLLDISHQDEEEKVIIDFDALNNQRQLISASFRCFCESGTCTLNSKRLETPLDLVVKFSAIKKSISTPDITLDTFPSSTVQKCNLPKNNSVPHNLEDPYSVVNVDDIITRNRCKNEEQSSNPNSLSHTSTLSSTAARPYSIKDISDVISLNSTSTTISLPSASNNTHLPLRKSSSSENSGNWSLHSCNSNVTIKSDSSFKSCIEESSEEDSDGTLHSDAESSDAETVKSDVSTAKRPWVHSDSFRFGGHSKAEIIDVIVEESALDDSKFESLSSKVESGISVEGSESSSSGEDDDSGVPRGDADVSLNTASLERGPVAGGVRSGSGRRRWDETEGTSEGDALSVSSAASSCAPLHLHNQEYSKVSGAKHYLKLGRSVDHYVESKLSYSEYEENHNSPRVIPIPNPRPSLKQRSQPVAITAMYENVVIKEQNPRRKLRRNNFLPGHENIETRMNDNRVRKYSNQERSSLESLLDDQSMNSPSECDRYSDGHRVGVPLSPTHYEQPPTPDHPPPSARQAENSIHEKIRPLSQLIMEVVEEIRIRKKNQGDNANS